MSDGSGATYKEKDTGSDGALHLFAQWSCIRYDSNYRQVIITSMVGKTYRQFADTTIKDVNDSSLGYSVEGYVFNGWKDDDGNEYKIGDTYNGSGVLILYAQWVKPWKTVGSAGFSADVVAYCFLCHRFPTIIPILPIVIMATVKRRR